MVELKRGRASRAAARAGRRACGRIEVDGRARPPRRHARARRPVDEQLVARRSPTSTYVIAVQVAALSARVSRRRTRTSSTSSRARFPAGSSSRSTPTSCPPEDGRDLRGERARRRRASAARVGPADAGCSARTRGSRSRALGGAPGRAARRAGRARRPGRDGCSSGSAASRPARAVVVRARRARARTARELRGTGVLEGAIATAPRGDGRASATTRSSSRRRGRGPSRSSATSGSASTRTAARCAGAARFASACGASGSDARRGVRHQFTSAPSTITFAITYSQTSSTPGRESACSTGLCFETSHEHRQHLERRLERRPPPRPRRAAPRAASASRSSARSRPTRGRRRRRARDARSRRPSRRRRCRRSRRSA